MTGNEQSGVAIVTGAARGLGREISATLHAQGWRVALADSNADGAHAAAVALDSTGETARAFTLDVRSAADVARVFSEVADVFEATPALLVSNAGIYPDHAFLEMSEEAWDQVLDVNLKGTFLCGQAFARARVAAGGGGAIVNLASTAAFSARAGASHYSASKAAIVMLTKSMAQELGPHGIRVNAVAPGLIEVGEGMVSAPYKAQMLTLLPRGRLGVPADIAGTVAFLASDAADFITGECIVVDGGLLTGRPLMRSRS